MAMRRTIFSFLGSKALGAADRTLSHWRAYRCGAGNSAHHAGPGCTESAQAVPGGTGRKSQWPLFKTRLAPFAAKGVSTWDEGTGLFRPPTGGFFFEPYARWPVPITGWGLFGSAIEKQRIWASFSSPGALFSFSGLFCFRESGLFRPVPKAGVCCRYLTPRCPRLRLAVS
jgi:hypothetical protein